MPHPQLPFRTARLIFLFSLIFFSAFTVSAQDITNLKFSDPKEKAAFGSSTLADSLLTTLCYSSAGASATDVENFKSKLNGVIENIAKSKGFQKDNAQRIKLIYKTIHDELFVQYELEHPFINLVLSGKYNCVSGTAIYAYVLERLNIPYQIKLLPQHVYLMAYPDTQPIRMEATQPEEGTTVFNDSFKKNYVNYLVSYKLVAKSELDHKSIDQIFTENFEKDESISFKELVGVQYWNQALYALEKENMEESHVNIQKAVQLYPCAKTKVLDTGIAAKLISTHRYKDPKADLGLLLSILKNDSSELIRNAMLDEFRQFSTIMINDRSDLTNYTSSSQWFIEQLTDSALKASVRVVFCLTEVSQHYMMSNFVKAMVYAEEAYAINPENDKSEAVLIDVLTKNLNKISNIERITDTLESYAIKYPKLKLNTEFKSIMGQAYLIRSSMMYESGKVKLAEKYRGLFEATVIPGSAHNVNENRIVDFYTQACFQYFRSGQQSAAVKALQTGLKYVPNEPSMSRRLMGIR